MDEWKNSTRSKLNKEREKKFTPAICENILFCQYRDMLKRTTCLSSKLNICFQQPSTIVVALHLRPQTKELFSLSFLFKLFYLFMATFCFQWLAGFGILCAVKYIGYWLISKWNFESSNEGELYFLTSILLIK